MTGGWKRRPLGSLIALLPLGGCSGWQSALDVHSAEAEHLAQLIWFIVGACALIWVAVVVVLALALRRGGKRDSDERGLRVAVTAAVTATALIVAGFTLLSFFASRQLPPASDVLRIEVRGLQWWWEVRYPPAGGASGFVTANEIHVPVGRPVLIELTSADVIHSFWVPSLAGKLDMIPGRVNELRFAALRPGIYRGQCAEFCGVQHAHMGLVVIAEEEGEFAAWRAAQTGDAPAPANPEAARGREVFLATPCAACHTVRGTPAVGRLGPDLTHLASRRTIAAGLLETTRGALAAWIADPQTLKPGNNMPRVTLKPDELRALSAYLAGLK